MTIFNPNDIDLISVADLIQLAMKASRWLKTFKGETKELGSPEDVFLKGTADPEMLQYLLTLCKQETVLFVFSIMSRLSEKEAKGYTYSILRYPNRLREMVIKSSPKGAGFGVEPKKEKEEKKTIDPRGTEFDSRVLYLELQHGIWEKLVASGKPEEDAYRYIISVLKKGQFLDRETLEEKAKKILDELVEFLKEKEPVINDAIYRSILGEDKFNEIGSDNRDRLKLACQEKLGVTTSDRKKKREETKRDIWLTAMFGKPYVWVDRWVNKRFKKNGNLNRFLVFSLKLISRRRFVPILLTAILLFTLLVLFFKNW
ncbi:MAG: hypothetical protein HGA33_05260 [Candidatus Moranbacteria bacterium]|nr:hypothetical protein [Candidatus Moranbacteria bacterium]